MFTRLAIVGLLISLGLNGAMMWPRADWWIVPGALAGWIIADFGSGLVHMLMDYYPCSPRLQFDKLYFHPDRNSEDFRRLKADIMTRASFFHQVVYDFKTHHPRPNTLGRRTFVELSRVTIPYGALPLSLGLNIFSVSYTLSAGLTAMLLTIIVGVALAQYFHATLHRSKVARPIAVLRRAGLLMTPAAHAYHHGTLDRDFATISGWTNPLLNLVFRCLRAAGIVTDVALEPVRS